MVFSNTPSSVKTLIQELKDRAHSIQDSNMGQTGAYMVSSEAYQASNEQKVVLESKANAINEMIVDSIRSLGISAEAYNDANVNAAKMVAGLALNPKAGLGIINRLKPTDGTLDPIALGVEDALAYTDISTEAYDGQKNDNCFFYSVAYNFVASKQDEFAEAYYPLIAIDPATSDVTIEIKFASLMNEVRRSVTGTTSRREFKKIPLPKAIYDNDVFATDKNRLFPVLRDENKDLLIEELKREDRSTLETIITAPIRFGNEVDLLGISQTDSLLARGQADHTDALDRAISLQNVYIQLTGDAGDEIFKIDTSTMSFNAFVANPLDHNKDMIFNFNRQKFTLGTSTTVKADGSASAILEALPEGYSFDIEVTISGDANTQYGNVTLNGVSAKLVAVKTASGDLVPSTGPDKDTFNKFDTVVKTLKFLGYDLLAYSTNSNLRKRGQLITVDSFKEKYPVPVRSGIMSMTPVNNDLGTDNDTDSIIGQAQALGAKISACAVEELFKAINSIKTITQDGSVEFGNELDTAGFKGVAKYIVNPTFEHRTIDLLQIVSSLDSKSRDESVRAAILQHINRVAVAMYIKSNYGVAYERIINGSSGSKITLIVGTDPNIKSLLVNDGGDTIKLGDMFDVKIVSTFNNKVKGKIIVTFGIFDGNRNSVPNPLNFGNCLYSPNIVYDLVRDIEGQTSRERHNNPRFLHITNLPIIAVLDVSNTEQVFGQIALPIVNKN